jgi:hypothetical protein
MFEPKNIDVSMAVIATDENYNKINETLKYNFKIFYKYEKIVVTNNLKVDYFNENEKLKKIHTDSFKVLENYDIALNNCMTEWCFLLHAGSSLNFDVISKLSKFITSDKDIVFPVKNRVHDFIKNPLNGLLINKKIYNKIGRFRNDNSEQIIKLLWAANAVIEGCIFKAIVGIHI